MKFGGKILLATGLFAALVVIANIPSVSLGLMVMMNDREYKKSNYHYSSESDKGFSVWSRKGYDDVVEQFELYKLQHRGDTVLFRNFRPVPWKVWRWREYLFEPRYKLPFRQPPDDAHTASRAL